MEPMTSSSMPFPTQFPEGGGSAGGVFWGDYAGLDAATNANPLWSDTRNPDLFLCPTLPPNVCTGQSNGTALNDQDAYTANLSIPNTG